MADFGKICICHRPKFGEIHKSKMLNIWTQDSQKVDESFELKYFSNIDMNQNGGIFNLIFQKHKKCRT